MSVVTFFGQLAERRDVAAARAQHGNAAMAVDAFAAADKAHQKAKQARKQERERKARWKAADAALTALMAKMRTWVKGQAHDTVPDPAARPPQASAAAASCEERQEQDGMPDMCGNMPLQ